MNDYRWEDLSLGMRARFEVPLTAEMMTAFAAVSGDLNPLHLDEVYARQKGFTGRVAFGMLTSSLYSRLVGMYLPGKRALLQGIDLEFKGPAYIDDVLSVSGEVTYLNEAYRRVEVKGQIVNQAGQVISTAKIRVGVHE
jgi:3-hydroxybutyryl-CoA dehydratase